MKYLIITFLCSSAFAKNYTEKEIEKIIEDRLAKERIAIVKKVKKYSVAELTADVLKRESDLEKKQKSFALEKERFQKSIVDFEMRLQEFGTRQSQFITCVDTLNEEKDSRVKKMVSVIASMKPAKAADLISVQDKDIAVNILSKLDTVKASKIFNLLAKEKSAELQKLYLDMKK